MSKNNSDFLIEPPWPSEPQTAGVAGTGFPKLWGDTICITASLRGTH